VPHSGPGSLYGVLGRVGEAYFQMLNEKGGINGRKIKFFTMDDSYSAPKAVEAPENNFYEQQLFFTGNILADLVVWSRHCDLFANVPALFKQKKDQNF